MEKSIDEVKAKIEENLEKGRAIIAATKEAETELTDLQESVEQDSGIERNLQEKRLIHLARGEFEDANSVNKQVSALNSKLVGKINALPVLKKRIELLKQDSRSNSDEGDLLRQKLGSIEFNLALDNMLVLFNNLKPHMSKFRENWPFVKGAPERISDEKLSELVSELGLKFI